MAYKLIYNPLIDYIRSHVRLCAAVLYSKASSVTVNSGVVCMHASQIYMCIYPRIMESREALL